ncbi:MAG: VCBS repeat-containing protein [Myxococcota bacterium]
MCIRSVLPLLAWLLMASAMIGCGAEDAAAPEPVAKKKASAPPAAAAEKASASAEPADLPQALVLALAQFPPMEPGTPPKPLPATMSFLVYRGGEWEVKEVSDDRSDVFHKVLAYRAPDGEDRILTGGGSAAILALWEKGADGYSVDDTETLWQQDFGGKFSRMRDIEVADVFGDGREVIVVATHDQGVVATITPMTSGRYEVQELDREPDTFVHEIETGDLDGDGTIEIYATPSEPNKLDGGEQSGRVTRYVPALGEGRKVVADLGERHAKEILVEDVDGDGLDELYVVVEGKIDKATKRLTQNVEVLRYDANTDPKQGLVIARYDDRLGRFLTAGDVDGDGQKEMVISLYSNGVWLMRPGGNPHAKWTTRLIDRNSGGFEHASLLADLDEDGVSELYVVSDKHGEVRRYIWKNGKPVREVIHKRTDGNSVFTWNLMPIPAEMVP